MRGGVALSVSLIVGLASSALGQSASNVSLSLTPASPVKGRDVTAQLEISIGGVAQPAPPVLRANVGSIDSIERVGPSRFRARYVLPTTRFPEVAIIVAFAPWPHPQSVEGAFGVLRVPIASAVEVPGKAEPGAVVGLELGGRAFGPVTAAADGTFRLPVVVPPGYGIAKTITRDRVGNKRTASLDLVLPPTDQLACVVTPTRLPADGVSKARVLCASSDRYGSPTQGARVVWKGGRGSFSAPRELGDGVQEWTWTTPRELGSGVEHMVASWKQRSVDSTDELTVELAQGPVRQVTLTALDELAHLGGVWRARALTRDQLGRPLAGVTVASAGLAPVVTDERGEALLRWTVPASTALGAHELVISASGPLGREPARLQAWRTDGGIGVLVSDLSGLPVAGQRVQAGAREVVTGEDGVVEFTPTPDVTELHHVEWPGLKVSLDGGLEKSQPRVAVPAPVLVGPALPVNVKTELSAGTLTWWVESSDGAVLEDREVELRGAGGTRRVKSHGQTREPLGAGLVSITDVQSRVTAVVEVAP
jgi:hypothetical protein